MKNEIEVICEKKIIVFSIMMKKRRKLRFFIAFLLAFHTVGDTFFYIYLYTSRMKVLVVNSGSSSLKYQVFNMEDQSILGKGLVERIGISGGIITHRTAS